MILTTFPVVILVLDGFRGSLVALFDAHGEILFHRDFGTWGEKEVYARDEQARKLEELIPWSFAHLIEVPGLDSNATYYWSESRVYSPQAREWLNIDPLFAWNPQELMKHHGNWEPTVYASHDPVNFVDPSGYWGVKFEWVSSVDAAMGVQRSSGVALTYSSKDGWQFGSYRTESELKIVAGAGLSTGIAFYLTNARNLNDIVGRSFDAGHKVGAGYVHDVNFSYSRMSDGFRTLSVGYGGSLGASYQGSVGIFLTEITDVYFGSDISQRGGGSSGGGAFDSGNYSMGNYTF